MIKECPGSLFIVAAPSGGGKTSLVKKLISTVSDIEVSISHTTRKKRPGEKEGVDYYFVEEQEFEAMVAEGNFIEHAQVFNHHYGTSKVQIYNRLHAGLDVVLDIDWQGAQQIKKLFVDAVSVFVVPPSLAILKQRLMARQQDDAQVIRNRMQRAQDELSHYSEFDYLIVNDDFNKAANELQAIVIAHRLRMERQLRQERKLLSFLLSPQ
ncbi:guanylate kinase [Legionella oakridgensis]|uniref:Guanylate kinase n=2 Tax=Legionella oakridgensis TaxID=29423 RepID=W0B9A4_9GAMM|nr:guanylate kinase [Legionella oakridgensis]AHE66430.1 guanylate kinase [Legionella oakridgensis ATCC 33761 = DSM 21215]ETO93784.1 guanylate kinase [Legionella oakridgensis RV-2-2007]KTD36869.1 guanylate kinase [Legionella oakridgensis]STY19606.1 guanylate kinase [Legionella longbeachae]